MSWSYVSLQSMRLTLGMKSASIDNDAKVTMIGEAVSRYIDKWTGRTFRTRSATLVFTPKLTDRLVLPDLLSLTTLKSDLDQDGVFEEVWTTSDYYLGEPNAPFDEKPYTWIATRPPNGQQSFPTMYASGVQVVGKWGYWEDLEPLSTVLSAAIVTTTATTITVSDSQIEAGQTILLGTEQMYVAARNAAGTSLTVERGVNGTTAATHLNGAAISRYNYPADIVAAANLHATRVWRRIEVPTGVINTPGDIGWRSVYIPKFDSDTIAFLQGYRRYARSFA